MSDESRLRKQIQTCKESDFCSPPDVGSSSVTSDDSDNFFGDALNGVGVVRKAERTLENMESFFVSLIKVGSASLVTQFNSSLWLQCVSFSSVVLARDIS